MNKQNDQQTMNGQTDEHSFKKLIEYIVHKNLSISETIKFLKEYDNVEINKLTFDDFFKFNFVFDYDSNLPDIEYLDYCKDICKHCNKKLITKYFIDYLESNIKVTIKNILSCFHKGL